jgi:hypothetical protein
MQPGTPAATNRQAPYMSRRWFLPQAVVALRRTAVGLESVAMVPGAFMALRRPQGPAGCQAPQPAAPTTGGQEPWVRRHAAP